MSEQGGGEGGGEERTVPYARFQEVVTAKNEWKTKAEGFQREIQELSEKVATTDTLAAQMADLKTAHKGQLAALQEELGLSRAGLNSVEGVATARALYSIQPEDQRPKTLTEWVQSFQGEGEDVPKPPPGLAPYLGQMPAKTSEEKPGPVVKPQRRGADHTPAPKVNQQAIRQARVDFGRNPSEENRKRLEQLLDAR